MQRRRIGDNLASGRALRYTAEGWQLRDLATGHKKEAKRESSREVLVEFGDNQTVAVVKSARETLSVQLR